jgi:hypothetical protein
MLFDDEKGRGTADLLELSGFLELGLNREEVDLSPGGAGFLDRFEDRAVGRLEEEVLVPLCHVEDVVGLHDNRDCGLLGGEILRNGLRLGRGRVKIGFSEVHVFGGFRLSCAGVSQSAAIYSIE